MGVCALFDPLLPLVEIRVDGANVKGAVVQKL